MTLVARAFAWSAALCVGAAVAAEPTWRVAADGPISIRVRQRPGSAVQEVWAEGDMAAPVQDIQAAIMEAERFPSFMPYVKEARTIGKPESDGSRYVYTRLELPLVAKRDYISRVYLDRSVGPDGRGDFANHWYAVPDRLPVRSNTIRLKLNEGSWQVSPRGDGAKSWVVYKFSSDPGGAIPAFVVDMGNKTAVSDTFRAIEKEAQRLAALRALRAKARR